MLIYRCDLLDQRGSQLLSKSVIQLRAGFFAPLLTWLYHFNWLIQILTDSAIYYVRFQKAIKQHFEKENSDMAYFTIGGTFMVRFATHNQTVGLKRLQIE